jgi:hypothetical protein
MSPPSTFSVFARTTDDFQHLSPPQSLHIAPSQRGSQPHLLLPQLALCTSFPIGHLVLKTPSRCASFNSVQDAASSARGWTIYDINDPLARHLNSTLLSFSSFLPVFASFSSGCCFPSPLGVEASALCPPLLSSDSWPFLVSFVLFYFPRFHCLLQVSCLSEPG